MSNQWNPFGPNRGNPPNGQQTPPQQPWPQRPQRPAGPPPTWVKYLKFWPVALILIIVIWIAGTSFYTVAEYEQAVVMTFGRYTNTVDAGLNWKLPYPIQRATILPVNRTQRLELGYHQNPDGTYSSDEEDSMMITGDLNVVSIDFFVEWKISDPVSYLFNSDEPDSILRSMLQSSVRSVVGTKDIDEVLTTGKVEIQVDVKDLLTTKIDATNLGIQILDVKVNDSEPPTEEIARAFREVENAKQQKDTMLNQAIQYQNSEMPAARTMADKIIRDAEAAKETRINEAIGNRDRFLAIYNEYQNYPSITRSRMYLEAIAQIFPGVTVYMDNGSGTQTLLPLAPFNDNPAAAVTATPTPSPTPEPTPAPEAEETNESTDSFN